MISDRYAIYWQAEIFDRKESNSKVLFLSSTSRCRKKTRRNYKKSNMFIPIHHRNICKSSFHNRSTFHPLPHVKITLPQEGFPSPKILRPRPRPFSSFASTAALASMSRSTTTSWPLKAANCSGVSPREAAAPWPKPRKQNPTKRKGRKTLRNFWRRKSRSFGNCGHSNSSLKVRNIVVLTCLGAIELFNKNSCLWYSIEAVSVDN